MYSMMDALCGSRAVKFDSYNNLLSSVHTILVIILRYVRLAILNENIIIIIHSFITKMYIKLFQGFNSEVISTLHNALTCIHTQTTIERNMKSMQYASASYSYQLSVPTKF